MSPHTPHDFGHGLSLTETQALTLLSQTIGHNRGKVPSPLHSQPPCVLPCEKPCAQQEKALTAEMQSAISMPPSKHHVNARSDAAALQRNDPHAVPGTTNGDFFKSWPSLRLRLECLLVLK